jgi:hypothetical protein
MVVDPIAIMQMLIFAAGIVYGYITKGQEDKVRLLRNGMVLAVGAGIAFGGISLTSLGLAGLLSTFIFAVIGIGIFTVLFVGGTIIGDFLEARIKKS